MIIGCFACSFSAFYFENHGNIQYGSPHNATRREQRSSQGKMEKSFLRFEAFHFLFFSATYEFSWNICKSVLSVSFYLQFPE